MNATELAVKRMCQGMLSQHNIIPLNMMIMDIVDDDYHATALMTQLMYWSGRTTDPEELIYKSWVDWKKELRLSRDISIRTTAKLKKKGLIITVIKKAPDGTPKTHYKIMWHKVSELLDCSKTIQSTVVKPDNPLSQNHTIIINTETTSENTYRERQSPSLKNSNFENSPSQSQPTTSTKKSFNEARGVVVGKSKTKANATAGRKNPHRAGGDDSAVDNSSVDVPGFSFEDVAGVVARVTAALNQAINSTFQASDSEKYIVNCLSSGLTETELMAVVDHVTGWVGDKKQEDFLAPIYIFGNRAGEYARKPKKSGNSKPLKTGSKREMYYLENPKTNQSATLIHESNIPVGSEAWDEHGIHTFL